MRKREGEWRWGGRGCKKCIWLPVNAAVRGTRLAWHSHFMRCGGAISLASLPILMIQFKWKSWSFRQHQGLHSLRSTYTHSKYTRDYTLVWCWVLYNFLFHKIKKYNLFLVSRGKTFTWRKTNHRLRLKSEKIWTEINLKKKNLNPFFFKFKHKKKKTGIFTECKFNIYTTHWFGSFLFLVLISIGSGEELQSNQLHHINS